MLNSQHPRKLVKFYHVIPEYIDKSNVQMNTSMFLQNFIPFALIKCHYDSDDLKPLSKISHINI